jgi:hypothetical protein
MSTLSIFCLRVRVKLFEVIHLSAGRFSYNNNRLFNVGVVKVIICLEIALTEVTK